MAKKIEDKSCQSNSDKRPSDFGSFLVICVLITTVKTNILTIMFYIMSHQALHIKTDYV